MDVTLGYWAVVRVRSENVVPDVRAAVFRASDRMEMVEFLRELEAGPRVGGDGEVGLSKGSYPRRWVNRFSRVLDSSTLRLVAYWLSALRLWRSLGIRGVWSGNGGPGKRRR